MSHHWSGSHEFPTRRKRSEGFLRAAQTSHQGDPRERYGEVLTVLMTFSIGCLEPSQRAGPLVSKCELVSRNLGGASTWKDANVREP
jgi:hypothetical protein